jgi:hypothetical protein
MENVHMSAIIPDAMIIMHAQLIDAHQPAVLILQSFAMMVMHVQMIYVIRRQENASIILKLAKQ